MRLKVKHRILFMFSLALLAVFCYSAISRLLFLARAERGFGVVRQVWAEDGRCGRRGRIECTKFFVSVEFQAAESRQFSSIDAGYVSSPDQPVSEARYKIGDLVPVVFDPRHPEDVYRDELWDLWGNLSLLLFLQILTLVVSLFRQPKEGGLITLLLKGKRPGT